MMKIRILSRPHDRAYEAGEVIDTDAPDAILTAEAAADLVAGGQAEEIDKPAKASK